jgi:succinate dehydrogenase/fumarate reductase flavoprotein subunit
MDADVLNRAALDRYTDRFDETFDVVVVGFGHAGGVAAIEAHDGGANVLIVEKAGVPGGISILCGGGIISTRHPEEALAYMRETNAGRTPDDVLQAFVKGMSEVLDYVNHLAAINNAEVTDRIRDANYPFTGFKTIRYVSINSVPGFDPVKEFPYAVGNRGIPNGIGIYKTVYDNVQARKIEVRLKTPALRLITSAQGEVRGLWVDGPDGPRAIAARRGVVLACGGFESNPEMQKQYWRVGPMAPQIRTHTGDGIRMAQDVGASLWHMWHAHGVYGFRHTDPEFPFGIRVKRLPDWTPSGVQTKAPLLWILVNREGKRFANEYPPYLQDSGHHAFEPFDTVTQTFPNLPAWMIFDEDGRKLYPVGQVIFNDPDIKTYNWSKDNLAEVENGILKRAGSLAEVAAITDMPLEALEATLARWNAAVAAGMDEEFGRPTPTLLPIKTPPFYVGQVWPILSNTHGGPVHDARQRVIGSFDAPIPRLYAAGELGALWGFLYQAGGNVAECFIGGRIAGRDVAGLTPWTNQ